MVSATRSFAGSSFGGATFEEDVAWELERLRAVGIERVVAVDLTLPEFGIPVVRIVIPGLEFHPEGREYTSGPRAKAALAGWIQDEIALRQVGEQSE
jgi:ribosomal protein S12 methylthiotransferase accessory factor